ncbi:hypothetical protein PHYPSEUDO_006590 [Phytophthora pseudosyringae]|uniref:Uncharacterized protein n=1 Tax=Phytophthora pseudosyringae TaxID=221518 RepID=A0A8T1VIB4_9STRA|nr:hypothetical protein PHYPSEUDO_006590 [Phytophthora pseudosyringae]
MPDPVPAFVSNQRQRGSGTKRTSRQQQSNARSTTTSQTIYRGTNTGAAPSSSGVTVDRPIYGPQLQSPARGAAQHIATYNGFVVLGPHARSPSQISNCNSSKSSTANPLADEPRNADRLATIMHLPHEVRHDPAPVMDPSDADYVTARTFAAQHVEEDPSLASYSDNESSAAQDHLHSASHVSRQNVAEFNIVSPGLH